MKKYQICSLCGTKIMTRHGQKYRKIKRKNWTLCMSCFKDYQKSQEVFREMTKEKKFKIENIDLGSVKSFTGLTFIHEPVYQFIPQHFINKPLRDEVLDKCAKDIGKCSMAVGKSIISGKKEIVANRTPTFVTGKIEVEWNKAMMETLQQLWEKEICTSSSKEFNNGTNKE